MTSARRRTCWRSPAPAATRCWPAAGRADLALVVDASVGLKWVLPEPDSPLAEALARGPETLLVPDFWLNEAANVLWLQVRRGRFTALEAVEALALLQAQVEPTPTAGLDLPAAALEIGLAIDHSPHDALYLAFAVAMGARAVVAADGPFARAVAAHPDPALSCMVLPLADWARAAGAG